MTVVRKSARWAIAGLETKQDPGVCMQGTKGSIDYSIRLVPGTGHTYLGVQ